MKKLLFALATLATFNIHAQVEPLNQFLFKSFVPGLVVYDSISASSDTGAAFFPTVTAGQHYFTNGHIDTLDIMVNGSPFLTYDGKLSGRTTTITGAMTGSTAYVDRLVYKQDTLFRDSLVEYYTYNSGSFVHNFSAVIFYTSATGNTVDHLDIYADLGSGVVKAGDYTFFYDNNNLDSIYYTISQSSLNPGYYKYFYEGPGGKLQKVEVYEDVDMSGEEEIVQRLIFKHNALMQITEITELIIDNNLNLQLAGAYRFNTRTHSTISVPETDGIKLSLYPNPAYDHLQVEYDREFFSQYEILSINGQRMGKGEAAGKLDVSDLERGIYILKLTGDKGSVTTRFNKM